VALTLASIYRYPVKSCRRDEMPQVEVEPWGLAGDRRWMLVDDGGALVTARERRRLLLVTPVLDGTALRLHAPGHPSLTVKVPEGELAQVSLWSRRLDATPAVPEAHAWFSEVAGMSLRLVYLDDPLRRRANPQFSAAGDRVSFADGYPLLLASESSLACLNRWVAEGPRASDGPLPMTRFRPNVVVRGAAAWAEDGWRLLRIGDVTFRAVKGCDRCVMTMIDPETLTTTKEPIATLARYRHWDGATWFGMNLIPDSLAAGAAIRVDDPVEILEQVDAPDGPPR
jgi:MOSC domain-containing protein